MQKPLDESLEQCKNQLKMENSKLKIKKLLPTSRFPLPASKGQSMAEYILVVFLVTLAVLQAVQVFGRALDLAFLQAINNITLNIK